jgi:hypothetical protein
MSTNNGLYGTETRRRRTEHAPIHIDGAVVEMVESFTFLGFHITDDLWSNHTDTVVKRHDNASFHS